MLWPWRFYPTAKLQLFLESKEQSFKSKTTVGYFPDPISLKKLVQSNQSAIKFLFYLEAVNYCAEE